ncbi:MAG: hypothetical protein Q7K34_04220 [archaeon]|nr:hypothetical protein [archaeon]
MPQNKPGKRGPRRPVPERDLHRELSDAKKRGSIGWVLLLKQKFYGELSDAKANRIGSIGGSWSALRAVLKSKRGGTDRRRGFLSTFASNRERTQRVLEIVNMLQRNGIYVPRIRAVDYAKGVLHFEHGGRTFGNLMEGTKKKNRKKKKAIPQKSTDPNSPESQRKRQTLRVLYKVFRMMGKVHALGVCHGHPHEENIVIRGNRVGLIDFKLASAEKPRELWRLPAQEIVNFFSSDYSRLEKDLLTNVLSMPGAPFGRRELVKKLFSAMVNRYPCSMEMKKEVLRQIDERHFLYFFTRPVK